MDELPKPEADIGEYRVSYNLETGSLIFERPFFEMRILAPPEFRTSMLAQKSLEDAVLVIRTSRLIQYLIDILDTQIMYYSRE